MNKVLNKLKAKVTAGQANQTSGELPQMEPGKVHRYHSNTPESDADTFEPHNFEREPHGLFILHPKSDVSGARSKPEVDIVAVHGLNGTAKKTWTDPESGKFWLEDFLPEALPKSRIMTFGYDSGLAFSRSRAGIENFARDLLNRLRMVKISSNSKNTPLIFIAHSLGGIVVKKALIIAHEAEAHYGCVITSTVGIVFMGTPHRGSELVPWALLFSNIVNIATLGQGIRKNLLRELDWKSTALMDISRQFVHRAASLKIVSFIEQQIQHPLATLVVPEYSAVLDLPNEIIMPLNAHHCNICRYHTKNHNYILVEAAIKELASHQLEPMPTNALVGAIKKADDIAPPTEMTLVPRALQLIIQNTASSDPSVRLSSSTTTSSLRRSEPTSRAANVGSGSQTIVEKMQGLSEKSHHPSETIAIRISGLTNKLTAETYGSATFSHIIRVPSDSPVAHLGNLLLKEQPKLKYWKSFQFPQYGTQIWTTWKDVFTTPVEVTSGQPSYRHANGALKINMNNTIAPFFSKVFPHPIEAKLYRDDDHDEHTPFTNVSSKHISIGKDGDSNLIISFMRTIRVPEDNQQYDLPPDLGSFPIFDIQPFSARLPPSMVAQGGLFLPMYQMEAMRINFESRKRFAVRPFLGGVNGITGEAAISDMSSLIRRMNSLTPKQDYVVLPDQKWLGGIATGPGVAKQFVATKMVPPRKKVSRRSLADVISDASDPGAQENEEDQDHPIGGTIEWQVTGHDKVGGVQLQLIPEFDKDIISACSMRDTCKTRKDWIPRSYIQPVPPHVKQYDVFKTPQELGLQVGDVIHIKDMTTLLKDREKVVGDLLAEAPTKLTANDVVEISIYFNKIAEWKFNVSQQNRPKESISLTVDANDEFGGILDVIQHKFSQPDGSLYMVGVIRNEPEYLFPVKTWADFHYVRDIPNAQSIHGDNSQNRRCEWDFVLASSNLHIPHRFCRVDVQRLHVFGGGGLFCIALKEDATILDLKHVLEKVTRVSSELCSIAKGEENMPNDAKVFREDLAPAQSCFPTFRMLYEGRMLIFIKTLADKTISIRCSMSDTVDDLQLMIWDKEGIPPNQQVYIFKGRVLDCGRTLSMYGVCKESTIHLVHPLRGGGSFLHVMHKGRKELVWLSGTEDIHFVKKSLETALGISMDRQILSYNDKNLDDDQSVQPYCRRILELIVLPAILPTALGIGAGGSILQHIERDTYDPRIWDLANAKILNVQIIDSTTFRLVTGLEAPEKTITAQMYKEMGLPFFKLWRDDAEEDGVAGVWESLIGVAEAASKNAKGRNKKGMAESSGTGRWGLLKSGEWGQIGEAEEEQFKEPSLDFQVVLLDVDDTLPRFRSAIEEIEDECDVEVVD